MFINVLSQVVILLILIMVGFALTKGKILTEQGIKSMTDLVLTLVTPCVIIKSFIRKFDRSLLKNLLVSFLIAFLIHLGFIILSRVFIKDENSARRRVLQFGTIFSNCGFMSIPLQEALLGDIGVFYGASFVAIFNLFIWTYGIVFMSGDKKYLTPKKAVINPGVIGIAVGLVIFLFSVPVPQVIANPISYIAGLNTPLPMIIIGYHLAQSDILKGFKDTKMIQALLCRLVFFPAVAVGAVYVCGIRGDMLVSSAISSCAPVAAITTMFSSKFSADTELSVTMVSLSTVISLITIPVIVTFSQMIA